MSWEGVTIMDQKVRFIAEYLKGYFPFSELCFQFSISRKTGYKWIHRYEDQGIEGLNNRSRRSINCPHQTDPAIIEAISAAAIISRSVTIDSVCRCFLLTDQTASNSCKPLLSGGQSWAERATQ